jgi:hypothetical protein
LDDTVERLLDTYEERESEIKAWSTKCSITTYASDYSVAMYTHPRECNFRDNEVWPGSDPWLNYRFVDRCLARYCQTSRASAMSAFTRTAGPITEADTYTVRGVSVSFWESSKTRLTASDEDPRYLSWAYGEIYTYTTVRT